MIRRQNPDGTWTEITDEEFVAAKGDEALRYLRSTPTPFDEMTEFERYMTDKMQSEAEVSVALRKAGIESLDDLPVEGDDEVLPAGDLSDFVPKEHDHELAARLYGGKKA